MAIFTRMRIIFTFTFYVLNLLSYVYGNECILSNKKFFCPTPNDPVDHTGCCIMENVTQVYCCRDYAVESANPLIWIIISITILCLLLTMLLVICCFWSKCPLYDSLFVNYAQRGVIAYLKEEEGLNQPPDEYDYNNQYTPINVKVNQIEDV